MKCKNFSDPVLRVFYLFYFLLYSQRVFLFEEREWEKGGREGGDWPLRTGIADKKRKVERDTETETNRQADEREKESRWERKAQKTAWLFWETKGKYSALHFSTLLFLILLLNPYKYQTYFMSFHLLFFYFY